MQFCSYQNRKSLSSVHSYRDVIPLKSLKSCVKVKFSAILTVRYSKSIRVKVWYIFIKSTIIKPLISCIFKITNHWLIIFKKYRFIFKSLFDWHRFIDYWFEVWMCPALVFMYIGNNNMGKEVQVQTHLCTVPVSARRVQVVTKTG
jgi:hypothetical protein